MDVSHDAVVPKGLHGIAQNVAADCLDDIFHKLGTVAFDTVPFYMLSVPM